MEDKLYSEYLGVELHTLKKYDVFNGFVNRDALYYILPYKFESIDIHEFKNSYDKYKQYFAKIIMILGYSNGKDRFYREAEKLLQFHEVGHIGLGYSKSDKSGSGIGKKFASQLTETAFQLVKAEIKDPEIFQMIGLLEDGIGADRISDMTIAILRNDLLLYTQRVSLELKVQTKKFKFEEAYYTLPFNVTNEPIIFCPKTVLTDLPVALDHDDIDYVCSHNILLRNSINKILGEIFDKRKGFVKRNFKKLILDNPSILKEIVELYKGKGRKYDFEKDPNGDFIWKEIASEVTQKHPLVINHQLPPIEVVNKICQQYKDLIENNGLWKDFHNEDGTYKNESFAQRLFFAIANSYCKSNNLDISPESNSGNGPVDFKIARGLDKINIEMKLSSNSRLLHGYTKQLEAYNKAEETMQSKFVIIQMDDNDIDRIQKIYDYKNKHAGIILPDIIVIDATRKASASKR